MRPEYWGSPAVGFGFLVLILAFVVLVIVLSLRAKQRTERARLIEKALSSGSLDEETRAALLEHLSGRSRRPEWLSTLYQHFLFLSKHALFVLGWLGLFTGIALFIAGMGFNLQELGIAGVITALVSFGVVTVPLALREVERRRA